MKGLSEFDPEEDDVICIVDSDDDDDDVIVQETKVPLKSVVDAKKNDNESESLDWTCQNCTVINSSANKICSVCSKNDSVVETDTAAPEDNVGFINNIALDTASAFELAAYIERIATNVETGKETLPPNVNYEEFWTLPQNYVIVLKLLRSIILQNNTGNLIDHVSATEEYVPILKNPLCFRDIVVALSDCDGYGDKQKGQLLTPSPSLKQWNMFEGRYLIQAVDLVFLNHLAFLGQGSNHARKLIQQLRSNFWREIRKVADEKKCIPARRTETCDFVIRK